MPPSTGSPLTLQLDLMPLEEKAPEAPPPKTMVVRYGFLKEIGEYPSDITSKVGCGTKLVIRTDRGMEIGEMLTTTCGNGGCSKSISRDKLIAYIDNSGGRDYPFSEQGRILRVATTQDLAEQSRLDENHKKHLDLARELVQTHKLSMKIVDVEHLLGGERILYYFVSEHRIDFRALVRDLAHALHTRIELRQVGARDEARLTADYEKCGQHCCCKQFLKVLTPISMRSAKVQKATLDPTKISGRCGRLMCCLRYEDETYEELRKKLPKRNTRVKTDKGDAWVIDGQILTQLVLVQFDDGKREAIPMEKVLEFDRPKPIMSDGRIMQTPNDRPPISAGMVADQRPRVPNGGPPPRRDRPKPGAPVQGLEGDPLAHQGPTGGDLSNGHGAVEEIDDLIADAMDAPSLSTPSISSDQTDTSEIDPRASAPSEPPPTPRDIPPRSPQLPRPASGPFAQRPGQPNVPRPAPSGPRGGPPRPNRPPQPRGPQGFRPPKFQAPGGNMPRQADLPGLPSPPSAGPTEGSSIPPAAPGENVLPPVPPESPASEPPPPAG